VICADLPGLAGGGAPVLVAEVLDLIPDLVDKSREAAGQISVHNLGAIVIAENLGVWEAVVGHNDVVGRISETCGVIRAVEEELSPVIGDNDVRSAAIEIRQGVAFTLFEKLKGQHMLATKALMERTDQTNFLRAQGEPLTNTVQGIKLANAPVGKQFLTFGVNPAYLLVLIVLEEVFKKKARTKPYQGYRTPSGTVDLAEKNAKTT
jgi:hypothetical protein